ncbi:unnamed protein product [Arabidopsis lyrata]|uniref:F-box/FBD/LRR-repeat protein At5g56420-like n=1 Tax=Arabidopsis lyrata subsp. lyrata TaxID=81972 RepID=UPI000A29C2AC|nr:F-box/FBD/LRR-repeat protein At5g56420-like [Arabidopsis lyrata subsp. lyrata]XP_020887208.1 F-box/FBD/LRR-repeat protein At5g56420-like [Arabidopsis lyrata subsp. lyrata]CAH8279894.1 unnamed protein product [Arabidopsis lyrata]|eukprot:XP_020887203.1 F-box/FBD/LRR-repeat protein At5g56420-like [Arabidopsis lyrata subsp. lyrata]
MDSFSGLTDDLLIKILSFVPIKDAVSTTILSKRWLSLWTLLPRLNFEDCWVDDEENGQVYCEELSSDFVFGTLLLHKSPVLESFRLSRESTCSASQIELWVRFAIDRFVHDLKIRFESEHCLIRLPSRLFRCDTLETLELKNVVFLEVPSRFSFQSLKTLRLLSVKYADEKSFIRLISSSAILENLVVESCSDDNVETFTINVASLSSLTVRNTLQESGPNYSLFVIHSRSLKKLNIVDECGEVNVTDKLTELVEAKVHTMETKGNALESLTFVKRLSLTLAYEAHYPIGSIFFQLVRLEFRGCGENWSNLLMHVLQHSPVLQFLKLDVLDDGQSNWNPEEDDKVCWMQPSCAPECVLYHLKAFEWTAYGGTEGEKEVAIYILKNARRLVTATVCPDRIRVSTLVFDDLEFATRGSRACELTMAEEI